MKMNLETLAERDDFMTNVQLQWPGSEESLKATEVILCAPFIHLEAIGRSLPRHFQLGAQDVFWENSGPYTGEVSPTMLREVGCAWVIVGHSERRKWLKENDHMIAKKVRASLHAGLRVVLCVGETKEEKESGKIASVLACQLQILQGISWEEGPVLIAYEPVWAIGTNITPTVDELREIRSTIGLIVKEFGHIGTAPIIYGGSVSPQTVDAVCVQPGLDGVLVGRDSLDARALRSIALAVDSSVA